MDVFVFDIASLIGIAAFAVSGWMLGVRKELDVIGGFIIAMLTANGGGVLRDVLVGKTPQILTDMSGFYSVVVILFMALLFKLHKYPGLERRVFFVISDSIGLIAFSITGAMVGLEANLNFFGVLLLGFLTAVGGGILRDILLNEVPALLSSGFYASVSLLISAGLFALSVLGKLDSTFILAIAVLGLIIRLAAHFKDWHLPKLQKGPPYLR